MQTTRWILAFLILSAVSAFADGIPGDPQMDPLPCSGSIALSLAANGSFIANNPSGPSTSLFATTLGPNGTTFCYSNQTGAPIGGVNITGNSPGLGNISPELFVCPSNNTLFSLCSVSIVGDAVTFSFLQGTGTGVAGCSFSDVTLDRGPVCGEFAFTAEGFPAGLAFTATQNTAVPEPSILAMMLPGAAYMGNKIRRRLRRS